MNLTIKLLTIHHLIVMKLLEIFAVDKEYATLGEYIKAKEMKRDELNAYVLKLLLKNKTEIQLLLDLTLEDAESIIQQHVVNEWGVREGEPFEDDTVKQKAIEAINTFILMALISTTSKRGGAEQKFDEIISVLKTQKNDDFNDFIQIGVIVQSLLENGLYSGYVDNKGIMWRVPREIGAIVNHIYHDTFELVLDYEIKARGIELVRVNSFARPREACKKLQQSGIICVVPRDEASEEANRYPNIYDAEHEYGEPSGHHGINCRHAWHSLDTSDFKMNIYAEMNKVNRYVKKYKRMLAKKVREVFE